MTWPAFCAWFFGPASTYLLARYAMRRTSSRANTAGQI
jgi:hypothetical protein